MMTLHETALLALAIGCAACSAAPAPSSNQTGTNSSAVDLRRSDTTGDDGGRGSNQGASGSLVVPPLPAVPPNTCQLALASDGGPLSTTDVDAGAGPSPAPPSGDEVTPFSTLAQFEALVVGQWARTDGQAELANETFGVELTADHGLFALQRAADGTVTRLPPDDLGVQSWSLDLNDPCSGPTLILRSASLPAESTYEIGAPIFFDGGASMYLVYSPSPANYARVAP